MAGPSPEVKAPSVDHCPQAIFERPAESCPKAVSEVSAKQSERQLLEATAKTLCYFALEGMLEVTQ